MKATKKIKKRLIAVLLTCSIFCIYTMPAFAATMSTFPAQYYGNSTAQYTRAIQVMLMRYNDITRSYIVKSGGADGSFGPSTKAAVQAFQSAEGISVDGSCGPTTWLHLNRSLQYLSTDNTYLFYRGKMTDEKIMRQTISGGAWYCYNIGWQYVG